MTKQQQLPRFRYLEGQWWFMSPIGPVLSWDLYWLSASIP